MSKKSYYLTFIIRPSACPVKFDINNTESFNYDIMDFEVGKTEVAFCPHCGNRAPQKLVYVQEYEGTWYSPKDGERTTGMVPSSYYYVTVCQTCYEILVYNEYEFDPKDNFTETNLIWPKVGLHKSVPKSVADCYTEAERIKYLAPNAFAVQIRKALEALCDDRKAEGRTLQQRLKSLVKKGEIPATLADISEALRVLGNSAAHSVEQGVKPIQVLSIDDFFRAIIEYVYVAPSKLRDFQDRTKKKATEKPK